MSITDKGTGWQQLLKGGLVWYAVCPLFTDRKRCAPV